MQALGLTRAGKPFGNQDLSRRQSREDRSVAGYRRDLKQGSGNIHESTRAARKFPEDARTAQRSYRGRIYFNSSPTVSVSVSQNVGNTGGANFSVQSNPSYPYGYTRQNILWDSTSYVAGLFTGYATFGIYYNSTAGGYVYELEDTLTAVANDGIADINSDHSLDLISLTYADGTTPESQGFAVTSASGIPSPNVASVPEPSSIVPFAIGLVGLAAHTCRGLRRKAVD